MEGQRPVHVIVDEILVDEPSALEKAQIEIEQAHRQEKQEIHNHWLRYGEGTTPLSMNRAERRDHNRRNGLNSDGSPKKRAL